MRFHTSQVFLLALLVASASCSGGAGDDAKNEALLANEAMRSRPSSDASARPGETPELSALVDLIVAQAGALPRAEFDPAALAAKLGKDPQAHFEWVRDNSWWAPYRGLLRGSRGVMLDRVGSNLDRAVLLGDLLRHSGHTVRLAHAQLLESRARELQGKLRPIPDERRPAAASRSVSKDQQRTIEAVIPDFDTELTDSVAGSRRLVDEGQRLVRTQADHLYAIVKVSEERSTAENATAIAALQDHWWVERKDGSNWIAMDVLLPDAKPGAAIAAAAATSEWKPGASAPAIPDSDWHSVRLRVVAERFENGATQEGTVLETNLRPAEVFDQPISLFHMPRPWPEVYPDIKADPNALGNAAVSVKEWVPVLMVGDQTVAQSGFTDAGVLIADPLSGSRDIAGAGGAGFMSGFDSALGGGETATSSMTAEWIDYEIRVPGRAVQHLRRPVFDLFGPVARKAPLDGFDASTNERLVQRYEALLSGTDILIQPCEFTGEFVTHLLIERVVANQAEFRQLAAESDPAKARERASALLNQLQRWGPLPDLTIWRSTLGGRPNDGFIDAPNVLNYRAGQPVVSADRIGLRELIDIVSNSTGVRPGAGRSAFEVRVRQGVADTVAELLTLGGNVREVENTASVFASTPEGMTAGTLIRPGDSGGVRKLAWPEVAAARLAADVDAGFVALASTQPAQLNGRTHVGWWRIDPASGQTIGVMDTGFHAATAAEKAKIEEMINRIRTYLDRTGRAWRRSTRSGTRLNPAQAQEMQERIALARLARLLGELL